jgi:sulfate/thiosulfate transport system permease protein
MPSSNRAILPGFRLSLGYSVAYLSLLVLLPLAACFIKAAQLSPARFLEAAWSPRAQSAYLLTFGASFTAAGVNVVFGVLVSWVLVRYTFPLKRLVDALVDLPFALPTAVAGLVYARLYVPTGWLGQVLSPLGIEGAYSRLGIVLVLIFTGFPFVVRTVQPVLQDFDPDVEEAAATLGAGRWQTFRRILTPALLPAVLTGFALAFARALGEYGSVVFIAGNRPMDTEIAPMLIVAHLEAFHYAEATAVAVVLLTLSFKMLALINLLERWSKRHGV